MKIIAILRNPVKRSLSRFVEQYNWPYPADLGFLNKVVQQYNSFEDYAKEDIQSMRTCLQEIDAVEGEEHHQQLRDALEYQCLARSNIVGWSAYSVFLKKWMESFPKEQFLVLYTSELEGDPEATMRKVEKFLGIEEHKYPDELLYTKFNTQGKYGWSKGVPSNKTSGPRALSVGTKSEEQDSTLVGARTSRGLSVDTISEEQDSTLIGARKSRVLSVDTISEEQDSTLVGVGTSRVLSVDTISEEQDSTLVGAGMSSQASSAGRLGVMTQHRSLPSLSRALTKGVGRAMTALKPRKVKPKKSGGAAKPQPQPQPQAETKSSEDLQGDTTLVAEFLRTYTLRLKAMADEGLIPPLPMDMFD
eukprot:gene11220-18848_t